jgi:hypothetical protein
MSAKFGTTGATGLSHHIRRHLPASYGTEAAAMPPVVTVGPDGSPESLARARRGADEAGKRWLTLRLLHAWPLPAPEPVSAAPEVDHDHRAKRRFPTAAARGVALPAPRLGGRRPVAVVPHD